MPNVFESDLLTGLQERSQAASASAIAEAEFVPPEEPIPQPEPVPYEPPATGTAGAEFVPPGQPIPQGIQGGYGVADGDSVSGGGYGVADGESATGTATASREVGDLRASNAGAEQARAQAGVEGENISPITGPVGGAFTGTVLSEARTRPEGYEPEDTSDLPYRGKALTFVLPQYRSGAIPQVTDDLPASFRATNAIKRIRQFGLPTELFAIAQTYFDPESGPGFYDPSRNAVAIGRVGTENTPYGQMVPIHEMLHAFEFNLTSEERARLEAILAKYPLPSGTPAEHHPTAGKDIYCGTGLPSYFDCIFADYVANGDFNAAPPSVPPEITRFIQEMAPIVAQRLKDQGKGQAQRAGDEQAQATAGAASEREQNRQRITELAAMPETQDTSTPEWRELRDLVRDERVRAFQDASFDQFAEAVYRQLLDKDPEGATRAQAQRIKQARIDAAGGDVDR